MQATFGSYETKTGYLPALSIMQPYAWRIVNGLQSVEHRSWYTGYCGPLLIHTGKKIDGAAIEKLPDVPHEASAYDTGGIVGMATLTGVIEREGPSRYAFLLKDMKPLPFVPFKGALGLFAVPESVLQPQPEETTLDLSQGIDISRLVDGNAPEGSIVICSRGRSSFGRTAMKWEKGDLCYVELEGKQYPGKVLDWAFSSEGDYLQIKLEYYRDWSGKTHMKAVQWPKPIQSYKLRKRVS